MATMQLYKQLGISERSNEPKLIISGMPNGTLVSLYTTLSGKHDFSGVVLVAPALLVEMTPHVESASVLCSAVKNTHPESKNRARGQ